MHKWQLNYINSNVPKIGLTPSSRIQEAVFKHNEWDSEQEIPNFNLNDSKHIPHFRLRVSTTSFLRKHQTPQLLTQRLIPHTCHSKLPAMIFKFPGVLMTGTRKLIVHVWEPIMKDINTVKRMALLGWMAGGTNSAYRKAFRWERAQALLERRVARSKLELQLQLPAQSINHNLI